MPPGLCLFLPLARASELVSTASIELPDFLRYRAVRVTGLGQALEPEERRREACGAIGPLQLLILPFHFIAFAQRRRQVAYPLLLLERGLERRRDCGRRDGGIEAGDHSRPGSCGCPADGSVVLPRRKLGGSVASSHEAIE